MKPTDYRLPVSVEIARAMRREALLERVCTGANGNAGLMSLLRTGQLTVWGAAWAYDRMAAMPDDGIGERS